MADSDDFEKSTARQPARPRKRWPVLSLRDVRLYSGLILFAFVSSHLVNHALGLVSLQALAAGREFFLALWRNPVGVVLLNGALMVHVALAFHAIYRRRTLRMSAGEAMQIVLGFAAPPLLVIHMLGTGYAATNFGIDDTYERVVLILWTDAASGVMKQITATLIVWVHGCIGVYYWARLKPWFVRARPVLHGVGRPDDVA